MLGKLKIRINLLRDIFWFVILISYFESPFLERYNAISIIYDIMKILSIVYIMKHFRYMKINKMFLVIAISQIALWYSTLRMDSTIVSVTSQILSVLLFCLTIDLMIKDDANKCINILCFIFEFMVYINFFSMLLFPNGLYIPSISNIGIKKYYFLGHQNTMAIYSLVGITLQNLKIQMCSSIRDGVRERRRMWLLIIVSIFYSIRVWSVISILCTVGIAGLFIVEEVRSQGFRIPLIWSIVVNGILFAEVVIFQNLEIFSRFIEDIFKRELTLSGRTFIWKRAWIAFEQSPIWGFGKSKGMELLGGLTAHNRYMNTLLTGGIIGMVFFVIMLVNLHKGLRDTDNKNVRILVIFFTLLLFAMQGESYEGSTFYLMVVIGSNVDKLINYELT